MFFEDHEKAIYVPATRPDLAFDPLAVDRALVIATNGKLSDLVAEAYPPLVDDGQGGKVEGGDISAEGQALSKLTKRAAEGPLADAARKAFGIAAFNPQDPNTTDGAVLEILLDYLWWMEKKGKRGETPPTS